MSAVLCRSCAPTELCLLKQSHLFGVPQEDQQSNRGAIQALLKEVCIFEFFRVYRYTSQADLRYILADLR